MPSGVLPGLETVFDVSTAPKTDTTRFINP
jgi:hypothetical protein